MGWKVPEIDEGGQVVVGILDSGDEPSDSNLLSGAAVVGQG